ncbi:putative serine acetyltransferase [Candidatus Methylobacter favarea]|uniref:serine O-acetyltransferase n=2 Tax=Candidatus Methylobacter favarea TaxID=2707345 RepID=A0A8S0WQA6_9GAMM|nr:putative serine acetyltransferase [Candidatus Methylobacter favarea]
MVRVMSDNATVNPEQPLGFLGQWKEDIYCVFGRDPAAHSVWDILLTYSGVHAVLVHRISHRLWKANWKLTARILSAMAKMFTSVEIHPGATIGRRLFIDHALGVVIGETAEIGNDVTLYHGVTLGGTTWNKEKRHPTLGNNVLVGSGAKILGAITLGNNVRVGANSVVVKDVPPCCTVVGIPGRVIQSKGTQIQNLRGIDLNHHLIPDPVGRAIACLIERIDELEARQMGGKVTDEEICDVCEAESVCIPRKEGPVKLAAGA